MIKNIISKKFHPQKTLRISVYPKYEVTVRFRGILRSIFVFFLFCHVKKSDFIGLYHREANLRR